MQQMARKRMAQYVRAHLFTAQARRDCKFLQFAAACWRVK
jgi:hypothetical protein